MRRSNSASSATSSTTTPIKDNGGGGSARSLHSPIARSRLNSKELIHNNNTEQQPQSQQTEVYSSSTGAASSQNNNALQSSFHSPRRTRFNSRDLPRSYSGQYHAGNDEADLLPLECLRSQQFLVSKVSFAVFLSTYMTLVLAIQFIATLLLSTTTTTITDTSSVADNASFTTTLHNSSSNTTFYLTSWTLTNAVHCLVTLAYVHWFKGSYLLDEQGELNAMTVWEQLEATAESSTHMRRTLLLVPTVLAYTACVTAHFEPIASALNVAVWCVAMLAKSPFMNGVRLFGINRTAGIDDYNCGSGSSLDGIVPTEAVAAAAAKKGD
jgi:ORMDL family